MRSPNSYLAFSHLEKALNPKVGIFAKVLREFVIL